MAQSSCDCSQSGVEMQAHPSFHLFTPQPTGSVLLAQQVSNSFIIELIDGEKNLKVKDHMLLYSKNVLKPLKLF